MVTRAWPFVSRTSGLVTVDQLVAAVLSAPVARTEIPARRVGSMGVPSAVPMINCNCALFRNRGGSSLKGDDKGTEAPTQMPPMVLRA